MNVDLRALFLAAAVLTTCPAPAASDGGTILKTQCAKCHNLTEVPPTTLDSVRNKKGPDLSSAGLKYKRTWLQNWLTSPKRIRPAGMFYGNHIKPGNKSDEIDPKTLAEHLRLPAAKAKTVTDTLMQYKRQQNLIKAGAYKSGSISVAMGDLLFVKLRGCASCHRIEPQYGGVSGPEVYTAADRLQEDYLISFMQNPQAWSPKTFMPSYKLKDRDLQKFVHYFKALAKENQK